MKKIISTVTLTIPTTVIGQVHLKNGSFIFPVEDQLDGRTGSFEMSRRYSSRSYHRGSFGYGWCSILEDKLDVDADPVKRVSCASPEEGEHIVFENGRYVLYLAGKVHAEYDIRGVLQRVHTGKNRFTLERDAAGKVVHLRGEKGEIINVLWDKEKKHIVSLKSAKGEIRFQYKDGELVGWAKAGQPAHELQYDENRNLTEIRSPGKSPVKIDYDKELDTVTRFNDGACETNFQYDRISEFTDETTFTRTCRGQGSFSGKQEYVYRKNDEGNDTLVTVRTVIGRRVSEVRFDEVDGKPLVIERGGKKARLRYAGSGKLSEIEVMSLPRRR